MRFGGTRTGNGFAQRRRPRRWPRYQSPRPRRTGLGGRGGNLAVVLRRGLTPGRTVPTAEWRPERLTANRRSGRWLGSGGFRPGPFILDRVQDVPNPLADGEHTPCG